MISSTLLIAPLLLAASAVARPAVPFVRRAGDVALSDWSSQSPPLESYWGFKQRYRALNCASQQGTDFYTSCCYPLEATQSLSDRPAECTPASTSCDASTAAATSSSASAPTYTDTYTESTNSNTNNNNNSNDGYVDDENLPICEDPDDDGEWHDDDDVTYSSSESPAPTYSAQPDAASPAPSPEQTPDYNSGNNNGGNTGTSNNNGGNTGSTGGDTYTNGWATFFWQGGNPGACGNYHADSDLIAALDTRMFNYDYGTLTSSWCGKYARVTRTDTGAQVVVQLQDACPTCDTYTSLDLSHGAFLAIATEAEGHVPISWSLV